MVQELCFGTRFLLTPEAFYSEQQKQMLIDTKEGQTRRTMTFDKTRDTLEWPESVDSKGIVNGTVQEYKAGKGISEKRQQRCIEAKKTDDTKQIVTWAGSVGNISRAQPAAETFAEIHIEAVNEN